VTAVEEYGVREKVREIAKALGGVGSIRYPVTGPKTQRGARGIALLFLDFGARRGGWSAPCPGRFTPGKDPVPTV
jgi:hypothetical protein